MGSIVNFLSKNRYEQLVFAMAFLMPLISGWSVKLIFFAFVLSFFQRKISTLISMVLIRAWDLFLYVAILFFGLLYSEYTNAGLQIIETSFCFIAFPFIFSGILSFNFQFLRKLYLYFIIGLVVACLICLVHATLSFQDSKDVKSFFFYNLTEIIDLQPTYLAYYINFGITFTLFLLANEVSGNIKIALISVLIFLFGILMLTGGQTSFLGLILIMSYFLLKYILTEQFDNRRQVIVLTATLVIAMLVLSGVRDKNQIDTLNDSWDRVELWKSAIRANTNILLGMGTGDSESSLNQDYRSHNLDRYADEKLNSHNQFLQIYLTNGVLGLIALVLVFIRSLFLSFKANESLGILILFPFAVYGIMEVFLGRYQGVVFFTFLQQSLTAYYNELMPNFKLR